MRLINEIIVHCSATHPEWWADRSIEDIRDEIRRWHLERKFNDIGYHRLIGRDGSTAEGRPPSKTGAHVKGHNANSLGVCLIGGTPNGKATDKFEDHFTPEQRVALCDTLNEWRDEFPIVVITGHNVYANKGCPAFNVADWLAEEPESTSTFPKWVKLLIAFILKLLRRKK